MSVQLLIKGEEHMSIEAMKAIKMVYANTTKHDWPDDIWDAICQAIEAEPSRSDIKQEQGEPVAWESVLGAVARGWCYEENANKTMDSELAVAIAKEVHALYTTPQPKREWVGLPHEEIDYQAKKDDHGFYFALGALWAEAKLKEKNT